MERFGVDDFSTIGVGNIHAQRKTTASQYGIYRRVCVARVG